MARSIVAIVGLQNVGKSMLFNRIVGSRVAVVSDEPGVTRDRNLRQVEWTGHEFLLVDTGGWMPENADGIDALVLDQTRVAVDEADVILFLVDAQLGAGEVELSLARIIKRRNKPCLLVGNKSDRAPEGPAAGLQSLGLGEPVLVSAIHGTSIGQMLDDLVALLPKQLDDEAASEGVRVAVIGRPNVGKSSLVNQLLGTYRNVVDAEPGTTRDAIDTPITVKGQPYVLVDTAGLRRRGRISSRVEFYSHLRSVHSIEKCDVALVLMDANHGVTQQDIRIAGLAHEAGRGSILVFNKMDLVQARRPLEKRLAEELERVMAFNPYAPVHFISVKEKHGTKALLPAARKVDGARRTRIQTADLNRTLQKIVEYHPPPGRRPTRIFYGTQIADCPPSFVVFASRPENIQRNYIRYLMNQLRKEYGFEGTPIKLSLRRRR
ncbi:MAG: ribosome biogenesis GTPase Der [Candidatus Eisenbacteria sp.]|nr:ribosome biogenesis GTPase Der [Candidatus Eisenbacteria bacterium]